MQKQKSSVEVRSPQRIDPDQAMLDFAVLRAILLASASSEDLKGVGVHAARGEESIEHMIRLNAGHDILHLKQLARFRRAVAQSA